MNDSSIFITASLISIIFIIIKFIEMRFVLKENKPLKILVRDTIIVYISYLLCHFILKQIGNKNIITAPSVFTDNPNF